MFSGAIGRYYVYLACRSRFTFPGNRFQKISHAIFDQSTLFFSHIITFIQVRFS